MADEDKFKVNDLAPLGLNLRSAPDPTANNIIAVIPHNHQVIKLEVSDPPHWWRVRTTLNNSTAEGFVNSRFLDPWEEPVPVQGVTEVHLSTTGMTVTRQNFLRAHPLTEIPPQKRHAEDEPDVRVTAIRSLIEWFKVESSKRYVPAGGSTFCNIYAYDYCFMTEAYMPRVWWTEQALIKLQAGQSVPVKYGDTVRELTANNLNRWFKDWGEHFGWSRVFSLTELQDAANQGKVCITVARAKPQFHGGHGHIVAVVPETGTFLAMREDDEVIKTVQSQAGAHNHSYIVQRWWNDTYADFGHWVHP